MSGQWSTLYKLPTSNHDLSAGYSSTYFALHSSFWLVVFTIGVCHGLAFVSVYAVANGAAQRWFPPERRGLIASIVAR